MKRALMFFLLLYSISALGDHCDRPGYLISLGEGKGFLSALSDVKCDSLWVSRILEDHKLSPEEALVLPAGYKICIPDEYINTTPSEEVANQSKEILKSWSEEAVGLQNAQAENGKSGPEEVSVETSDVQTTTSLEVEGIVKTPRRDNPVIDPALESRESLLREGEKKEVSTPGLWARFKNQVSRLKNWIVEKVTDKKGSDREKEQATSPLIPLWFWINLFLLFIFILLVFLIKSHTVSGPALIEVGPTRFEGCVVYECLACKTFPFKQEELEEHSNNCSKRNRKVI